MSVSQNFCVAVVTALAHSGCHDRRPPSGWPINGKHFFFTVLEAERPRTRHQTELVSGESPCPKQRLLALPPSPGGGRVGVLWGPPCKGTNPIRDVLTS